MKRQKTQKPLKKSGNGSIAVLDVGTAKIACFIAYIDSAGEIKIAGIGHQLSKGIRAGVITDFAEAETSIANAVHAAEQMAGDVVHRAMRRVDRRQARGIAQFGLVRGVEPGAEAATGVRVRGEVVGVRRLAADQLPVEAGQPGGVAGDGAIQVVQASQRRGVIGSV